MGKRGSILVTREMIAVGAHVLENLIQTADSEFLVSQVYIAMARLACRQPLSPKSKEVYQRQRRPLCDKKAF